MMSYMSKYSPGADQLASLRSDWSNECSKPKTCPVSCPRKVTDIAPGEASTPPWVPESPTSTLNIATTPAYFDVSTSGNASIAPFTLSQRPGLELRKSACFCWSVRQPNTSVPSRLMAPCDAAIQ